MQYRGPPSLLWLVLTPFVLTLLLDGCDDSRVYRGSVTGPGKGGYGNWVIVHTVGGAHLVFGASHFRPQVIEHCREDGRQHLTSIYELTELFPGGHTTRSMCPELSGRFMIFRLVFPDQPLQKVTSLCEDGCVTPGGYYDPLGVDVRIPWSEISYIEVRR